MSDITEGIGGVVEGALAGRAVDSRGGEGAVIVLDPLDCPNCGANHTSPYCPQCGQKRHIHRTLSALGHDLIHGVLHLDGKFWKTLPLLLFKPGKLTRRYIEGERAKFVSPMAMFLFSVFAMFAVFQMVGLSTPASFNTDGVQATANFAENVLVDELDQARERLKSSTLSPAERVQAEEEINKLEQRLERVRNGENPFALDPEGAEAASGEQAERGIEDWDFVFTGIKSIDQGLIRKWQENPGLMLYKLQTNAYKFSWLLIPLSVPFVWLLFAWKRRFKAYDHAIFVTYSIAFTSLLFILLSVLAVAGVAPEILIPLGLLAPPLHLYKNLRGTYELGRFGAFWRLLVLSLFIWIVILLFLQALFLIGAF